MSIPISLCAHTAELRIVSCHLEALFIEKVCQFHFYSLTLPLRKELVHMSTKTMTKLIAEYFKTQPVLKAWLFGSYSRGEERLDSDVDILVALDENDHVELLKQSGMHLDLQDGFHHHALQRPPLQIVRYHG